MSAHGLSEGRRDHFAMTLAAIVSAFVLSPWAYVAVGALSHFPFVLAIPSAALLLAATFQVVVVNVRRSAPVRSHSSSMRIPLAASIAASAAAGLVLSRFSLFTRFERIGLFATIWLVASAICLPLIVLRGESALEVWIRGATGRGRTLLVAATTAGVLALVILSLLYMIGPARFIRAFHAHLSARASSVILAHSAVGSDVTIVTALRVMSWHDVGRIAALDRLRWPVSNE